MHICKAKFGQPKICAASTHTTQVCKFSKAGGQLTGVQGVDANKYASPSEPGKPTSCVGSGQLFGVHAVDAHKYASPVS